MSNPDGIPVHAAPRHFQNQESYLACRKRLFGPDFHLFEPNLYWPVDGGRPNSPENILTNMFSHIVIFWTDPEIPKAVEELIAGANEYLKPIPGVLHFHVGKMAQSHRPVVDQTYQVALNLIFPDKKTQDDYQVHPQHVEFVEKVFKRVCQRVVVYDFE